MDAASLFDLSQWSAFVGFLFPLVAAFLKQSGLSKQMNTVIAVVFAIVVAVVVTAQNGDLSWERWAVSFIALFTVAGATYKSLWNPIGVEPVIQAKTSFIKPSPGEE